MLSEEEKAHYDRHIILPEIGLEGQRKLKSSSALVLGAGGLGAPLLQYLAAAGIGKIGVVDDDVVSVSNLHRQVLYTVNEIGMKKAEVAVKKLSSLNPHIELVAYSKRFTSQNALELLAGYDILVDGCDNFVTRYLANDTAVISDKPLVSGSVFKFEGQVGVFNYKGGPTYRCLYPDPPAEGEMPSCGEVGVLGVLPGMIGTMMANEVIKIALEKEGVLSGRLLLLNALSMQTQILSFKRLAEQASIKELKEIELVCATDDPSLLIWDEFEQLSRDSYFILDVRSTSEYSNWNIKGHLIPLNELEERRNELSKSDKILVHCEKGGRAQKAVSILKENGFKDVRYFVVPPDQRG